MTGAETRLSIHIQAFTYQENKAVISKINWDRKFGAVVIDQQD
jgi:hypothetical protein